ncbi:MAG: hypothetical protein L3J34_04115 [Flavobacteriaceae bacterium]|nr:hypothetical protein [Flavobacteriaceae bacterium]
MKYTEDKLDYLIKKVDTIYDKFLKRETSGVKEFNGYISQTDAIKKYNLSKDWFWRRRNSGQLPFKKLGARVFYAQKDLFNLLEDFSQC